MAEALPGIYLYKPHGLYAPKVDAVRCRAAVHESGRGVAFYQCLRASKYTINGVCLCGTHARLLPDALRPKELVAPARKPTRFEQKLLAMHRQESHEQAQRAAFKKIRNLTLTPRVGNAREIVQICDAMLKDEA